MKHKPALRLIDDFVARPGSGPVSGHPQAVNFPSVGTTLSAYGTNARAQSSRKHPERPRPGVKLTRWQRFRTKFSWKRALLILGVLVLLFVGWFGWKFFGNISKIFGGNIFGIFNSTKLRGEDTGRVNILLAGNSADDPGHDGGILTDSIMIISLDTVHHTAFMLSIPRDLWVNIPDNGYAKINAAYEYGEQGHFSEAGYPSGGMGLLEKVVHQNFGLPINYYALINYSALKDAVNAVGGVDITIHSSDPRGLYDPSIDWATGGPLVNLTNGTHHLDGEQALDLARARGDAYGSYGFPQADFNRTEHQRQMIVALKDKIISAGVLANPIKLTNLFDSLGKNVRTDFTVSEAHRLYDLMKQIPSSDMKSESLNDAQGKNLLSSYTAPNGSSALVPAAGLDNYSEIQQFIQQLTSNNPVVREDASVVLLNATNSYGVAKANADKLEPEGVTVARLADASDVQNNTLIIDVSHGKKPNTLSLLKRTYSGASVTTTNPYASLYPEADFIVVLGQNQAT